MFQEAATIQTNQFLSLAVRDLFQRFQLPIAAAISSIKILN